MTRKRDIQRRFLEKNGWAFDIQGWYFPISHEHEYNIPLGRESAFKMELKDHPQPVRRELKRRIAECQE